VAAFSTTSISCQINCKTPDINTFEQNNLTFTINYSQFKCALLCENIFIIIRLEPPVFLRTLIVIKQRSSLVNPTIVTKLQFIRIKQNLFTSADDERRHLVKLIREWTKVANTTHLTIYRKLQYQKVVTFWLTVVVNKAPRCTADGVVETLWKDGDDLFSAMCHSGSGVDREATISGIRLMRRLQLGQYLDVCIGLLEVLPCYFLWTQFISLHFGRPHMMSALGDIIACLRPGDTYSCFYTLEKFAVFTFARWQQRHLTTTHTFTSAGWIITTRSRAVHWMSAQSQFDYSLIVADAWRAAAGYSS